MKSWEYRAAAVVVVSVVYAAEGQIEMMHLHFVACSERIVSEGVVVVGIAVADDAAAAAAAVLVDAFVGAVEDSAEGRGRKDGKSLASAIEGRSFDDWMVTLLPCVPRTPGEAARDCSAHGCSARGRNDRRHIPY